ncbi:cytochrome-c oxidase, cbb3-type subunit II [Eikenella sp. S3360]|uniref:Cytochrome-c oxidase, cbb3-type subunit II n=1 Tax=Eikenella glucosivorans TaxID=2766967 RepID=A0ABS0NBX1_9NEIS|nr:cytochrome-c oxidase, cbb3-type subunit II [Eikenella glucosivorans]MBH5329803.1 cytochrome-c oxidase, cbb3-type subunit II [Eikenella glucosivorans]
MQLQKLAEEKVGYLIVFTFLLISIGLIVEVVPLYFSPAVTEPTPGVKPYTALQVAGRDIYIREGCYNCHSQMIRPFRAETERYGHYSVAGESVYDHPFQWGSKRTGPDLARVGGRYSDEWHRRHLMDPRAVQPDSNMPAFPWLARRRVDGETVAANMRALRRVGVPYSDEEIAAAPAEVEGKSEMEAVIAYLQGLGLALKNTNEIRK